MLVFIPFALLLITPLLMVGMQLLKPKFSYFWLVSLFTGFLVWASTLLIRLVLPFQLSLPSWGQAELFPIPPTFILDIPAWSVMMAVATLLFAAILTDTVWVASLEGRSSDWIYWTFGMILTAFTLLAIISGNLLAFAFTLAALDLVELVIYLVLSTHPQTGERIVIAYSARIASLLLVILSIVIGTASSFNELTSMANFFLVLAIGLRLGVLPFNSPFPKTLFDRQGISVLIQLLPTAPCIIILVRIAGTELPTATIPWLVLFTGISAIYASATWASSRDKRITSAFWVIGMGGIVFASAIRTQAEAALAWGLSLLLTGGIISLYTMQSRRLVSLLYLGLIAFTALPFTPTWWGVLTFSPPWSFALFLLLATHALLLVGYLRRMMQSSRASLPSQRWIWLFYLLGLFILLATQFIIPVWNILESSEQFLYPPWTQAWFALASILIAAVILLVPWRKLGFLKPISRGLKEIISFSWMYRLLWWIYHTIRRATYLVSDILEGSSGILWALLLLTLVISLIAQIRSGG